MKGRYCARFISCAVLVWACAVVGLASGHVHAASIVDGEYILRNHPDAGHAPPPYGLRLDELFDVTASHDIWTFDFDHVDSDVRMLVNTAAGTIHIQGPVYGGLDSSDTYHASYQGLFDLSFNYSMVEPATGDDDLLVDMTNAGLGSGVITPQFGDGLAGVAQDIPVSLSDYPGHFPFSFRLGDEDDDLGYRGFAGISGWGWLLHGDSGFYHQSSDFIFVAFSEPVTIPEPAAGLMLLAGLVFPRRKRRR